MTPNTDLYQLPKYQLFKGKSSKIHYKSIRYGFLTFLYYRRLAKNWVAWSHSEIE